MNENSKMWGGRFLKKTNEMMNAFQASIGFDRRLWQEDIEGSLAHAKQLYEQGILGLEDYDKICEGLKKIMERAERGELEFREELEDIHMNIEAALSEEIGLEAGGRLHTARSRNDQVALDSHLYLRRRTREVLEQIHQLVGALLEVARDNKEVIMPGYTHLQRAQAIPFAHHLLAYVSMLRRDADRFALAFKHCDILGGWEERHHTVW